MGEYADDAVDQGLDELFYRDDYYDEVDPDYGSYTHRPRRRPKIVAFEPLYGSVTGTKTEKAILWRFLSGDEEWLPFSQILKIEHDCITVTEWIAEKKDLNPRILNRRPAIQPESKRKLFGSLKNPE